VKRSVQADWGREGPLGGTAARGGVVTALGTWSRFLLQLATMVVVARLVGPAEYGTASVLLVLVLFAELVRAGGVLAAVVRATPLGPGVVSTLHVLSIAAGAACAAAVLAVPPLTRAAPLLPALDIPPVLAVVFVAAGLGAVPTALLSRNLRFLTIALAEVASTVVAATTAVLLALHGAGAGALVAQAVVYAVSLCVLILASCPWRPTRPAPLADVRGEAAFALDVTTVQFVEWAIRTADRVVVAALFGPTAVGLWAQASQLLVLPLEQVNGPLRRVAVPVLAKVVDDDDRYAAGFRALLGLTCTVLWPAFAVLGVLADVVVVLLFGEAWQGSSAVFRGLLGVAVAQTVAYVVAWVFVSTGAGRRQRLFTVATLPLLAIAYAVGSSWGVVGVAAASSVAAVVTVVPAFLLAARDTPLSVRDLGRPLPAPALVAATCAVVAMAVRDALGDAPAVLLVTVGGAVSLAAWATVVALLPPCRRPLVLVLGRLRRSA